MTAEIIPAILSHSVENYQKKLELLEGLTEKVHVDIMDGHFVPNLTVSLKEIGSIHTTLERAAHLMITNPEDYFDLLNIYSFSEVIIHPEGSSEQLTHERLNRAKKNGLKVGLAINPETLENQLSLYTNEIDFVQVMAVHPGFGGQKYQENTLGKIARISRLNSRLPIAVDGGVNLDNLADFYHAGARKFIIGSAIFQADTKLTLNQFQDQLARLAVSGG